VEFLLPLTFLFLAISVGALLHRAKERRGYKPFILGLGASITIIISKFVYNSDIVMYIGLAALVAASLIHSWPKGWLRGLVRRIKHGKVAK
jgi:hypothetical protein